MNNSTLLSLFVAITLVPTLTRGLSAQTSVAVNDSQTLLVADLVAGTFQGTDFTVGPTTTFEINDGGRYGERGTNSYDTTFDFNGSTMNVNSGGTVGSCNSSASCGILSNLNLNVYDGAHINSILKTGSGTVTNFYKGTLDRAILEADSTFNLYDTNSSSGVSLFQARPGSKLNISGGRFQNFDAPPGSEVKLVGGDFQLNGAAYTDPSISLTSNDTFSGVLSDGNIFVLAPASNLSYSNIQLDSVGLPEITEASFVVDGTEESRPHNLRDGQKMSLLPGGRVDVLHAKSASIEVLGGVLGSNSRVVDTHVEMSSGETGYRFQAFEGSTVNVTGGSLGGDNYARDGSVWNVYGGSHGSFFTAYGGSEVNVFGGSFDTAFTSLLGSKVNIHGGTLSDMLVYGGDVSLFVRSAALNDTPVDLEMAVPVEITERSFDSILEVVLSDGSPLTMYLYPDQGKPPSAFVHPDANLFVILVPEPSGICVAWVCFGLTLLARRRGLNVNRGT